MHEPFEITCGCILVGFSLTCILILTLWSCKIIKYIAERNEATARHLLNDLNGNS